ncbi:MAG: hypothetical protein EXS00_07950, partial [Phycisphaerales bacterium]|nr:hypothetical protein [Phycisphaerales bacterium]
MRSMLMHMFSCSTLLFRLSISAALLLGVTSTVSGQGAVATNKPKLQRPAEANESAIGSGGAAVGAKLANVQVVNLKGEAVDLATLWEKKPVLIVTASMTCPKSRTTCVKLEAVQKSVGEHCDVVILYTVEAHPKGSDSPYRPGKGEWVTGINERQGVLRAQPKTLEERLALANELDKRLESKTRMVVDYLNNGAWRALGMAPNMAVLVDTNSIVRLKEPWLDANTAAGSVNAIIHGVASPVANKPIDDSPADTKSPA